MWDGWFNDTRRLNKLESNVYVFYEWQYHLKILEFKENSDTLEILRNACTLWTWVSSLRNVIHINQLKVSEKIKSASQKKWVILFS